MTLRFGTDGIRGDAEADLTSDLVVALGRAAARVLGGEHPFLIGRDTRASGARLERDLVRGLAAEGTPARVTGVLPTPGVAHLAGEDDVAAAMISASHNPWSDNGIKLFARGGRKLPDEVEADIEAELVGLRGAPAPEPVADAGPPEPDAEARYLEHLTTALEGRRLDGLRVVVDCANGAASSVAPAALRALGAQVVALHASPDGRNINHGCGSTHPDDLQRAVPAAEADVGLALDGDADRVLAVDEHGALVDGDQLLLVAALDLHARGRLAGDTVALTVMSNLGLRRALADAGLEVVETAVGDRQVLAAMEEHGLNLGGEQSGHIVFGDLATTGDGTLTGLWLLDRMARGGEPLSALAGGMTRLPQVLESVRVARRPDLTGADGLWAAVRAEEETLGEDGRVLLRASGTEPVVRIMVEAPTDQQARDAVARLHDTVVAFFEAG
jgi:phosphoglucosamine mutase